MSEEVLVNVTPQQTFVAVVAQGLLQDIFIEQEQSPTRVGNIYLGKVARILTGIGAFVDIGLPHLAFLSIEEVLNKNICAGQNLLVQVTQEPLHAKGATITTHLCLSSRCLVMSPGESDIRVSNRITDATERERLKALFSSNMPAINASFIIRTAAVGITSFEPELTFLQQQWLEIQNLQQQNVSPELLLQELPLTLRALRDIVPSSAVNIKCDNLEVVQQLQNLAAKLPNLHATIDLYNDPFPIFDFYKIRRQIKSALDSKVLLKNAAYLLFEQTEALTVIDVNSGAFIGKGDIESAKYAINLAAAKEIPRQLRLRNISGIIIVDFINLNQDKHKANIIATLETAFALDPIKTTISSVSPLGIVQITRKRQRASLQQQLCSECTTCSGRGVVNNYA